MTPLYAWLRAFIVTVLFLINTMFHGSLVAFMAPIIWLFEFPLWRKFWRTIMLFFARGFIHCNTALLKTFYKIDWDVEGLDNLKKDGTYLVMGNHLSLNDIPVAQGIFVNNIPFLRFFIKLELLYVPFLGQALWALEYPTMKRYSKEDMKKYPELRGKDLETAKQSCDNFRGNPVTMLNYAEGTRYTPAKHAKSKSPHKHLLKPRAGGVHTVLDSLADDLDAVLDVTLVYPGHPSPNFQDMIMGRIDRIVVRIDQLKLGVDGTPSPDTIRNKGGSLAVRKWLNERWKIKDLKIMEILNEPIEDAEKDQATLEPLATEAVGESKTTPASPE